MGPAGAGKSTVGRALAAALGCTFLDADDLHSPENIAKIGGGAALTDVERGPWLDRVRSAIADATHAGDDTVVACSALRRSYRDRIARGLSGVRWVYLHASPALLAERLTHRTGHFAGPAILSSQLATLESPDDALVIPAHLPVDAAVAMIRTALR